MTARVRESWWPAVHAAVASALAWWFAYRVLGHAQPFFAPIAATISLSTSYMQRTRRIVQMVIGVLAGVAIAEALYAILPYGTASLGVIVLVTLLVARALGARSLGDGMMFANQAGASAILVVVVHRHGTGAERAIDVLVGGASAYVIGVLLFPSQPLPRIYEAERAVLAELAAALGAVAVRLAEGGAVEPGFTMQTGYRIHELLGRVAIARSTALLNVRLAPRRWRLRAVVEREEMRISRLDLLANAVLSLVRVTSRALDDAEPVPGALSDQIVALRDAIERLASTQHPWPASLRADVDAVAAGAIAHVQAQPVSRVPVIGSILRSTAADVQALIQAETAV